MKERTVNTERRTDTSAPRLDSYRCEKYMMMRMPILYRPASLLGSLYSLKIYIRNVYFKNTVNYSYYCHFYCVMGATFLYIGISVDPFSFFCFAPAALVRFQFFTFFFLARTVRCIRADRIFGTTKKKGLNFRRISYSFTSSDSNKCSCISYIWNYLDVSVLPRRFLTFLASQFLPRFLDFFFLSF